MGLWPSPLLYGPGPHGLRFLSSLSALSLKPWGASKKTLYESIDPFIKASGRADLKEGLVPVLKKMAQEKKHQTMSTMEFKTLLEKHTGLDFSDLFEFYIKE